MRENNVLNSSGCYGHENARDAENRAMVEKNDYREFYIRKEKPTCLHFY
jgi:hypothetical protein